jgi:hypothetical protein
LLSRGQHLIATIQTNSKGFPKGLELDKKAPGDESVAAYCVHTGCRVTTWPDNKDVTVLSTVGKLDRKIMVPRKGKHQGVRKAVSVPMPSTGRDCFKRFHDEGYDVSMCRKRRSKPRPSPASLGTRKRARGRPKSSPPPTPTPKPEFNESDPTTDLDCDEMAE